MASHRAIKTSCLIPETISFPCVINSITQSQCTKIQSLITTAVKMALECTSTDVKYQQYCLKSVCKVDIWAVRVQRDCRMKAWRACLNLCTVRTIVLLSISTRFSDYQFIAQIPHQLTAQRPIQRLQNTLPFNLVINPELLLTNLNQRPKRKTF